MNVFAALFLGSILRPGTPTRWDEDAVGRSLVHYANHPHPHSWRDAPLPGSLPSAPLLEAHSLGMYHIGLTGVLRPEAGPVTVTLVTYLKASYARNGSLIWHGRTTVYEPTTETFEDDAWEHHMSRHDIVSTLQPHVFLRSATRDFVQPGHRDDYSFTFATPHAYTNMPLWRGYPWVINMCMDNPPEEINFYFGVDGWQYSALLTGGFMRIPQYVEPDTVEHNKLLGVNATILYERGTYVHELFHNNATKQALHEGHLKIMLWDQHSARVPLLPEPHFIDRGSMYVKYDQQQVYDHALTMLYGMNAYVLIVDHDELVVLPQETPDAALGGSMLHNSLLHGCLAPANHVYEFERKGFPNCKEPMARALWDCVVATEPKPPSSQQHKAMIKVDVCYSTEMHYPKASIQQGDDQMVFVASDCAFIAHIHWNNFQW